MKHTTFKRLTPLLLIVGLALSGCTASDAIYVQGVSGVNWTGATGAAGATGNFTGTFTGNTTFTGPSNNFTGNNTYSGNNSFTGNNVFGGYGSTVAGVRNNNFVVHAAADANMFFSATGSTIQWNIVNDANSLNMPVQIRAGLFEFATGDVTFGDAKGIVNYSGRTTIVTSYNGTGYSEIMRFIGNNVTAVQFTKPPKFSVQNVTGPSNNVTPVTWINVLLADNSTAWIPAYK